MEGRKSKSLPCNEKKRELDEGKGESPEKAVGKNTINDRRVDRWGGGRSPPWEDAGRNRT